MFLKGVHPAEELLHRSRGRPCRFSRASLVSVPTSPERGSSCPVFADTGCGLSVSSSPSWWPCSWSLAVVLICIPSHLMTLSTFSCYCRAVCCSLPVSKLVSASCQGLGILEMFRGYVFSWVTNASSHSLTFLSTLMMTLSGRHIADAVF